MGITPRMNLMRNRDYKNLQEKLHQEEAIIRRSLLNKWRRNRREKAIQKESTTK
jgi:hypothetical protein